MRLFFGIELSDNARRAAADYALTARRFWPGRYVDPDNYHMTLCYVGEADERQTEEILSVGQCVAQGMVFSSLKLDAFGYFGKKDKAILYLNAEGGENYARCAVLLRKHLHEKNLPHDPKPFYPHITLARNAGLTDEILPNPRPVLWTPSCITLFHSHRVNDILAYTPIMRWTSACRSR